MAVRLPSIALRALLALGPVLAAAPAPAQDAAPDEAPAAPEPTGDDCASVIVRWRDFAGREDRDGHMDASVFERIQGEIARADQVCRDGRDAQARRLVAESKRRHGYPP